MATLDACVESNATFSSPPLDGSLTIPEIYDYHLVHNPKHPFFVYATGDGSIQTIIWEKVVQAIYRASFLVEPDQRLTEYSESDVIAILANTDTVTYFALIAGIIRAGHQAFPICTSLSDIALAHLLIQTNAKSLFVSGDAAMQNLAKSACERVSNSGGIACNILSFPTFESLFNDVNPAAAPRPTPKRSGDMTAVILHSSGSTGLPKPIRMSHRTLLSRACSPYYGEISLSGRVISCHSLKPTYAWAFGVQYCWTAATGVVVSVLQPTDPPVAATPSLIVEQAVATKSDILLTTPHILKPLLNNTVDLEALRSFLTVVSGGGPLSKDVGDRLIREGVSLNVVYGATEVGVVSIFPIERHHGDNWEYFKISPHCRPILVKQEGSKDLYRVSFAVCSSHIPSILNSELPDGSLAYDTGDLLSRHPDYPDLWKLCGRADDRIVTTQGKNINMYPIEEALCKNSTVSQAIVFGHGRMHIGVLLEPIDPHIDHLKFLKGISTNVEEVNDFVPTYSRIFEGMIIVADPLRPFPCTRKGNPRRGLILETYKKEIDEAYESFEKASQALGGVHRVMYADRRRM